MKFGDNLRKLRKSKGLSQEELAEKVQVSRQSVSKWETGLCLMDMSLLRPLSSLLDVSVNEILLGEQIKDEDFKDKADENIINITELYDLKSSKLGVVSFTGISLLLLLYCSKKEINTLPIIIIWFRYNLSYLYNRYKFAKNKKDLIISLLYGLGYVISVILFLVNTF